MESPLRGDLERGDFSTLENNHQEPAVPPSPLPLTVWTSGHSGISSITFRPELYHGRALYPMTDDDAMKDDNDASKGDDDGCDATGSTTVNASKPSLEDMQHRLSDKLATAASPTHCTKQQDLNYTAVETVSRGDEASHKVEASDFFASIQAGVEDMPRVRTEHDKVDELSFMLRSSGCSIPGAYAEVRGQIRLRSPYQAQSSFLELGDMSPSQENTTDWSDNNDNNNNTLVNAELAPENFEEIIAERDALRQTIGSIQEATAVVLTNSESEDNNSTTSTCSRRRSRERRRLCIGGVAVVCICAVALAVVVGVILGLGKNNDNIVSGGAAATNTDSNTTNTSTTNSFFWESRRIGQTLFGAAAYDEYGESVSISSDGTILAAGGEEHGDFAGRVVLYQLQEDTRQWRELFEILGEMPGDEAGRLALSGDASMLAIAGIRASSDQGEEQMGRIRTFHLSLWNATAVDDTKGPQQRQALSPPPPSPEMYYNATPQVLRGRHAMQKFGSDVQYSEDGSIMAVGSTGTRLGNLTEVGSVQVFQYNATAERWDAVGQELFGDKETDFFGTNVFVSADGFTLVAGGYGSDVNRERSGMVRVYKLNQESLLWEQLGETFYGESANDELGRSIALSSDGRIVAFGGYRHNQDAGRVYVYKWSNQNAVWNPMGQSIDGLSSGDRLGRSVYLSGDGQVLAAGAYWNNATGDRAGHVRVFRWNSTTIESWDEFGPPISGNAGDWFGRQIALSKDGKALAIGGPFHDSVIGIRAGKVEVYSLD